MLGGGRIVAEMAPVDEAHCQPISTSRGTIHGSTAEADGSGRTRRRRAEAGDPVGAVGRVSVVSDMGAYHCVHG
ncbi:hypothetical protein RE9416_16360 [Prescottella equi]|nr:hypothetical protein RE9416_16360 [Prescottella equi]BCN58295.1 hypothetical protein RE9427_16650 [Prescottella equi]BCN78070.1 hypothetical protein RE0346_17300 [Prescottella equi]BDC71850.1 hypothetical protein KAREA_17650 [Prescottella equi]BDE58615.1 hypothetical protein REA19_16310 [Prescottella equi]